MAQPPLMGQVVKLTTLSKLSNSSWRGILMLYIEHVLFIISSIAGLKKTLCVSVFD